MKTFYIPNARLVLNGLALMLVLMLSCVWIKEHFFSSAFHQLSKSGNAEMNSEFGFGGQGASPRAIAFYTEALKAWRPEDGIAEKIEVLKNRSKLLLCESGPVGGKDKEVEADYSAILDVDPTDYDIYAKRAEKRYALELYDQAIADYNIALNSTCVPGAKNESCYEKEYLYYGRGLCYFQKKNFTDAISDFTAAIKSNRSNAVKTVESPVVDFYRNRAKSYNRIRLYDNAIKDFSEAIKSKLLSELKKDEVYRERGYAYIQKKQYEKAINDFNQAIAISTTSDSISEGWYPKIIFDYRERSYAYKKFGQIEKSKQDMAKAERYGSMGYSKNPPLPPEDLPLN